MTKTSEFLENSEVWISKAKAPAKMKKPVAKKPATKPKPKTKKKK